MYIELKHVSYTVQRKKRRLFAGSKEKEMHYHGTGDRHKTRQDNVFCLKDISFKIEEGYMTGIVGVNGAGKTTIFHMLMNMQKNYEGEILLNDKDIKTNYQDMMHIGLISEEHRFIAKKSMLDNATLMGFFYDDYSEEIFKEKMKEFGVPYVREFGSCSRGEKIKFQLAFALSHDSRILLIDEGTAGMDPVFRKDFFKILHYFMEDETHAILMSTHNEEEIKRHMDYVIYLRDGKAERKCNEEYQ